jgi:hypothetical protein
VNAFCTACGGPRMPLAASSVNMAGQPSKVGGTVARVFGWMVLAGGWLAAAMFMLLIMALSPAGGASVPAWILGGIIATIASLVAYGLLKSGRQLHDSGALAEMTTKNQAIFALANTRGGVLTAMDLAQSIMTTPQEADDVLTKLAKEYPDHVTVDIDDIGTVLYRFPTVHWQKMRVAEPGPNVRVGAPAPDPVEAEEELEVPAARRRHAR